MNQERGIRGVDEEFFMIFSWTHHVTELEWPAEIRNTAPALKRKTVSRRINNWELNREWEDGFKEEQCEMELGQKGGSEYATR